MKKMGGTICVVVLLFVGLTISPAMGCTFKADITQETAARYYLAEMEELVTVDFLDYTGITPVKNVLKLPESEWTALRNELRTIKTSSESIEESLNEQKLLGSAYVYGDGIEENTVVDAVAGDDLIIRISSQTEIVDFYITYDITCDGDYDEGRVYFLLQINGEEQGQREVITFYSESGNLVFEDVEVSLLDILTFEIGAVYTNLIPPFVIPDIAIGGGLVNKAASFNINCEQLSQHFSQPAH